MSDLQRIQNDIARAKQRIAEMEAGTRGIVSDGARHTDPGRAFENQLHAQRQSLARFEEEYLTAMVAEHRWSPADIIRRMQAPATPARAPEPIPVQTIKVGDLTRGRLQSLLEETIGNFIPRSKLSELLSK